MRRQLLWAAIAASCIGMSPTARADTCYDPNNVNFDCTAQPKQSGAPKPAAGAQQNTLREELRRNLSDGGGTSAQAKNIAAIKERWVDAQQRAQDATDRGMQTSDPQERAQLKHQYETAMRDLRKAGNDLMRADPQEKGTIEALLKEYETKGAEAAAQAGFTAPSPAAPSAPAAAPRPDNVTVIGDKVYVCDGTIAGVNNVSCREISADGTQCLAVTLADGVVGWRNSTPMPCRPDDLAQRKAFLAQDAGAAAAVANAPPAFTMDPSQTDREVRRLTGDPQCQALVQNYIAAAQANDGPKAFAGYNALKEAGGCGVLDKVDRPMPAASVDGPSVDDPRFISRGATPLSDQVVGGCDAAPDVCAARVRELRAGTSPDAIAALYSNAISIGLQLGTMMGNAMLSGVPTPAAGRGASTNMNSIGNRPVQHTYGQGHPNNPAPPQSQSTITGIGSH